MTVGTAKYKRLALQEIYSSDFYLRVMDGHQLLNAARKNAHRIRDDITYPYPRIMEKSCRYTEKRVIVEYKLY